MTLIVEMLEPYSGRVYDPAMGSGGFFVSSSKFIEQHAQEQQYDAAEQKKHISVYGQESNPTTWKLAAMNMAIRGIDFNFGKKNADTFLDNQHPDLRADFVMANPPFNVKDWWSITGGRCALAIRHATQRQRQLCLDSAHAASPCAHGQHGLAAGQRLHELQHQQRRRNPQAFG